VPNDPSSWTDLIGESVYTSDDQDIGDIEAVSRNFIVVKKGLVNVHDTISLFTGLKVGTAT
jgi:ribosomal 30S subunit maturation factor RimM